jgi:hypothetical protein
LPEFSVPLNRHKGRRTAQSACACSAALVEVWPDIRSTNLGDIPYSHVTRFELALNLKTAQSLGHEFPAALLVVE